MLGIAWKRATPSPLLQNAFYVYYALVGSAEGAVADLHEAARDAVTPTIDEAVRKTPLASEKVKSLMTCLRALMLRTNEWALAHRSSPRVAPIKPDRRFLEVVESGGSVGQYLSDIMLPSRLATTSDLTEEALQIKKLMSRAMYLPRHLPRVLPGS